MENDNTSNIQRFRLENEQGVLECELEAIFQTSDIRSQDIIARLREIDKEIDLNFKQGELIQEEIYNNTSHADKLDYIIAASCGFLTGLIDVFFVGTFSLDRGKAWSNKTVNNFVMDVAKKCGYSGDRLDGAIKFLEDKYKIASDNAFSGQGIGVSPKSHHLDDFAHHPTIIGLLFSLATQFSGYAFFSNSAGAFQIVKAEASRIGSDFPSKIFKGTIEWFFHLVSDMSGSNKTAGVGMGIPGPILSLAKEFSSLPFINQTDLPKYLDELFKKEHFDLRTELAIGYELGRQSIPVVLNEVLVRGFYLVRRIYMQWKEKRSFKLIEWRKTLPFKNPTITRMIFVASGTFACVDLVDAAIRSKGRWELMILRINFVNVGRFTLAISDELGYAIKRNQLNSEYSKVLLQRIMLYNLQLAYQDQGVWLNGKDAIYAVANTYKAFVDYIPEYQQRERAIQDRIARMKTCLNEKKAKQSLPMSISESVPETRQSSKLSFWDKVKKYIKNNY